MALGGTEEVLLRACEDLDRTPVQPNDSHAMEFFERFPFPTLLTVFSANNLEPGQMDLVLSTIQHLLSTPSGTSLLTGAGPYLAMACGAVQPSLRRLAARQLGRLLVLQHGTGENQNIVGQLIGLLKDSETGVASEAERSLLVWCAGQPSSPPLLQGAAAEQLHALAASSSSTISSRVVALVVALGCVSREAAQQLQSTGLLDLLSSPLETARDPLSKMSTLSLLKELCDEVVQQQQQGGDTAPAALPRAGAQHLLALLAPRLQPLLLPLAADPLLRPSALMVSAGLLAAELLPSGPASAIEVEDTAGGQSSVTLLEIAAQALDDKGDEPPESEVAVLDALGYLGVSRRASEMVLCSSSHPQIPALILSRALGRAPTQEIRLTALHAAASLAGVERAQRYGERRAAVMNTAAEDALRQATYSACSSAGAARSPSEVLLELMQQPFDDVRTALYRFIAALALRPWFVMEVVRHSGLMEVVLSNSSVVGQQQVQWRYAAVCALHSRLQADMPVANGNGAGQPASLLSSVAVQLQRAVQAGPYGQGPSVQQPVHLVATLP